MSVVEQILAQSRVTIESGGIEFLMRKITAPIAVRVLGTKALGLVRGSMADNKEIDDERGLKIMRGYLESCMISPAIGAVSDPDKDIVCFDDLGGMEPDLFTKLMKISGWGEQVLDFQEPSKVVTE